MATDLLVCKVSAPGKIILHGEHSVVYGKTAIAASLGLRTTVKIQEKKTFGEPNVTVNLTNVHFMITFGIRSLQQSLLLIPILTKDKKFNWLAPETIDHDKYLKTIEEFLEEHKSKYEIKMSDVQFQGMKIVLYLYCGIFNKLDIKTNIELTVDSGLTINAGTGSSASFAVSLTACMLHYLRLQQTDLYFSTLNGSDDKKFDLENFNITEKNLISKWAFFCEKIAHGNPSGVDNATCTFGSLIEFKKGSKPIPHSMNFKLRVLLVDSRVSRQTKDLVQKVVDMRKKYPAVVDGIMETLNKVAISALKVFQKMNEGKDMDDQYEQLAELFEINHNLLVTLNVSHPSLEKIRTTSAKYDLRTKLTGAGGGGFAIVLVPEGCDEDKLKKLIHTLDGSGFNTKLTDIGGDGVAIH